MKKAHYVPFLEEQIKIANEREKQYGSAKDTIRESNEILRVAFGIEISDYVFTSVLMATKLARNKHKRKKDNMLDFGNYSAIRENL